MLQWNDLRYFLAVASEGSTLAAARLLRVNQSTVQRRIVELETSLGLRLVERSASGYRLTPAGEAVLASARQVAAAVEDFEKICAEKAHETVLRLTCPEPIADRLAKSGFLDRFRAAHPDLRVEFVLADHYVDLAKGDADVAFRSGDTDGVLVGRKVASSVWAIYASSAYVERYGKPGSIAEIARHPVVAFEPGLSGHRLSRWLNEVAPNAHVAVRCGSVLGLVSAVRSGLGISALPIALGDADPDLVRVLPPVRDLERAWRLLCHPDVRHLHRVQAFFDFVGEQAEALRPVLTG